MLTYSIASPNVRFVHIDLVVKRVIDTDIGAGRTIDAIHYFMKIRTVSAIAFANIQYEQVGMDHFVLQNEIENFQSVSIAMSLMASIVNLPTAFQSNSVVYAISIAARSIEW